MGKAKRILTIALLVAIPFAIFSQQEKMNSREAEEKSYLLYQQGDWKALSRFVEEALVDGNDYYYLRLRGGIAYFEMQRYQKAAEHFREALAFNSSDPLTLEYLYACYVELNRGPEAHEIFSRLPESTRDRFRSSLPGLSAVNAEEGFITGNQMDKFDTLDIDGADNLYGETDITQDGIYAQAGVKYGFKKGHSVTGSYTYIKLNKNKIARIGDTLSVDDLYPLRQHQIYLNGLIPLGNGFSILPAFNLILDRYETVMPRLAADSINYLLPVEQFRETFFIGYLAVHKDFGILQASAFGAWSDLNSQRQIQGGMEATIYPYGNLNFYLTSKLVSHLNDDDLHLIFDQMAGFKVAKNLWAEADVTFGQLHNYHEKSAFVVYNITDMIRFKGGAKLIYMLRPRWIISADYLFLLRNGEYLSYVMGDDLVARPVIKTEDFYNHVFLLGLKWKF